MLLLERVWKAAVSFVSVFSFSPIPDGFDNQASLQVPLITSPIHQVADFPKFPPPGGSAKSNFTCEYPQMPDWEDCSHEQNRQCWLRNKKDGRQFNISTDYETMMPTGIERHYTLDIADSWWAADGMNFTEAKLFNNSYPGPWIQACWGDRLIINVTNHMKHNGTSVHWHGIRQLNTTHMDGVNGVTQCPIAPGDHFVYNFTLLQYGSSWYHSHYSVQYADGAAGPMTIHGPSSGNWDEAISPPLIMTDWYHNSAFEAIYTGGKNKTILLNGRGNVTSFNNEWKNTTAIRPPLNITFKSTPPGKVAKKYLIRVINTSFDTTFVFSIDNHLLSVISADFVPIHPYQNTSILVGIGQRYNVIVEANPIKSPETPLDPDGNYWIRTQIASCFRGSDNGSIGYEESGILRYNELSTKNPTTKIWPKISTKCSDETYTSLKPIIPWTVDLKPFGGEFDVFFKGQPDIFPLANFVMDEPGESTPLRVEYSNPTFLHLNPKYNDPWPSLWRVEPKDYPKNGWIYLVLHGFEGTDTGGAHPIHLHGHDFAILEQAESKPWNPAFVNITIKNPPRRDVVLLPTNGYVIIAFKADNPGPWLVHCHIAVHISFGLGMQIMEDRESAFSIWPDNSPAIREATRVCGNWDSWYANRTNWANRPLAIGGNCTEQETEFCFQDDSGV